MNELKLFTLSMIFCTMSGFTVEDFSDQNFENCKNSEEIVLGMYVKVKTIIENPNNSGNFQDGISSWGCGFIAAKSCAKAKTKIFYPNARIVTYTTIDNKPLCP